MDIDYVHRFITSMLFTITIETSVLALLLTCVFKKQLSLKEIVFAGSFASFATIPYVWFVFPYIADWSRGTSFLVSEPFVFLIEAFFYNRYLKLDWKTALFVSLLCNSASYFLGPILRANGLWIYW